MKIQFNVPGEMSIEDSIVFTKRVKNDYGVKILGNVSTVGFSDSTVYGMTAEGPDANVKRFAASGLKHVNWLRIS